MINIQNNFRIYQKDNREVIFLFVFRKDHALMKTCNLKQKWTK